MLSRYTKEWVVNNPLLPCGQSCLAVFCTIVPRKASINSMVYNRSFPVIFCLNFTSTNHLSTTSTLPNSSSADFWTTFGAQSTIQKHLKRQFLVVSNQHSSLHSKKISKLKTKLTFSQNSSILGKHLVFIHLQQIEIMPLKKNQTFIKKQLAIIQVSDYFFAALQRGKLPNESLNRKSH